MKTSDKLQGVELITKARKVGFSDYYEKYIKDQSERIKAIEKSLNVMTSLCRIKYGNLDKDVYAEIEKAEQLLNSKP